MLVTFTMVESYDFSWTEKLHIGKTFEKYQNYYELLKYIS